MTTACHESARRGRLLVVCGLALLFALSLFLRTFFVWDQVFTADHVNLQGADPWYHLRAIEHLVVRFPHRIEFDPYALYPGGERVAVAPLFDLVLAGLILILGLGSPSPALTQTVVAWSPAVAGALIVFPVYFLGKVMLDRKAGLIAAAWIAVLPGTFLRHSLLGYADHHVAESLLAVVTMLVLVLALERARLKSATAPTAAASPPVRRFTRLMWTIAAGLCLGMYLLTWVGGSLLVLVIFVALAAQLLLDFLRDRSVAYISRVAVPVGLIALALVLPYRSTLGFDHHITALIGMVVALSVAAGVATFLTGRRGGKVLFPAAILLFGLVAVLAFRAFSSSHFDAVIHSLRVFLGGRAGTTVVEAMPLLYPYGQFSLSMTWDMFTLGAATTVLSLPVLGYAVWKRGRPAHVVIFLSTVMVLAATLRQQRFAYYLALNVAVLTGCFWSGLFNLVAHWAGRVLGSQSTKMSAARHGEPEASEESAREEGRRAFRRPVRWMRACGPLAAVLIAMAAWLPNLAPALREARGHAGPHADWLAALDWLRESSPEPFGDERAYTAAYGAPSADTPFPYPDTAYGIMCWWDYGYWIEAIARRIPVANPTQAGASEAARFFSATDETSANDIMDTLGARYVVLDYTLPAWDRGEPGKLFGKFGRIVEWTGRHRSEFYEWYYARREDGKLHPRVVFYPAYYQSLLVRLYVFAGRAVVPDDSVWAVAYTDEKDGSGQPFKMIRRAIRFKTYAEAEAFVQSRTSGKWRIGGTDPTRSCVPLEALRNYERVYASPTKAADGPVGEMALVQIYAYRK